MIFPVGLHGKRFFKIFLNLVTLSSPVSNVLFGKNLKPFSSAPMKQDVRVCGKKLVFLGKLNRSPIENGQLRKQKGLTAEISEALENLSVI